MHADMGKPHPVELRDHSVALVDQGNTHTEAVRRLCVRRITPQTKANDY